MDGDREISEEEARSVAKRWAIIILLAQFVVFYVPLVAAGLLYAASGYKFAPLSESLPQSFACAILSGWAYDVFACLAWKRLVTPETDFAKVKKGVRDGLMALSTPHVFGNAVMSPFYFLDEPLKAHDVSGFGFWSFLFIPLLGLLFSKAAKPYVKKVR